MPIVKSLRRISCSFPQGGPHSFLSKRTTSFTLREDCILSLRENCILSLREDHILFPQGELYPFPSGRTTHPFPQGGSHPFPSGRTTSFSLRDASLPELVYWEGLASAVSLVITKCFHKVTSFHMWFPWLLMDWQISELSIQLQAHSSALASPWYPRGSWIQPKSFPFSFWILFYLKSTRQTSF